MAVAETSGRSDSSERVTCELIADVSSIVPGQPFHLGVHFKIDPHWHIYWKYSGETGQPTRVAWEAPKGFEIGPLVYPGPRKFVDAADIISFGYEDEVLLWAKVTPPKDVREGQKVIFEAKASWLACKTLCVIGERSVRLELPVAASGKQPARANEALFRGAQAGVAVPADKAKHVRVDARVSPQRISPGDRFEIRLGLSVERGWHIQSNKPLDDSFIATDLFLAPPETIELERPAFPPGKVRAFSGMKVSEYGGEVLVRVPGRTTGDLKPGKLLIDGVLVFQACNESGTCLPPQYVAVKVPIEGIAKGASTDSAASSPVAGERISSGTASPAGGGVSIASGKDSVDAHRVSAASETSQRPVGSSRGLAALLALAFLGGMLLNVMPCVLPVVSIKIVSFVQQAGEEPRRIFLLGLSFASGMLLFFLCLGLLAMTVRIEPGWVLQRPLGVVLLTSIIFAFGLSLFGVFDVRLPGGAASRLSQAGSSEGPGGAVAKGFLVTILGTSCTAPFLSYAWVGAMGSSPPVRVLIFLTMGLGMSLPYVILSAKPGWLRFLPRPGPWMEGFKQLMGFLLIGTAIWLLWVLAGHVGAEGVILTLVFLTVLSLGLWMIGRVPPTASTGRYLAVHASSLVIVLASGWFLHGKLRHLTGDPKEIVIALDSGRSAGVAEFDFAESIPWQPYRPGLAEELAGAGRIAYVDYTARWCPTCQSNKRLVLDTEEVRSAMQRLKVVPIEADFTRGSETIKKDLNRFSRPSVPLNLVYGPASPNDPIVLPEILTKGRVLEALEEAARATSEKGMTSAKASGPA